MDPNPLCSAQTYWYEHGEQMAKFCAEPAEYWVRALDGGRWRACHVHMEGAKQAGAEVSRLPKEATP